MTHCPKHLSAYHIIPESSPVKLIVLQSPLMSKYISIVCNFSKAPLLKAICEQTESGKYQTVWGQSSREFSSRFRL